MDHVACRAATTRRRTLAGRHPRPCAAAQCARARRTRSSAGDHRMSRMSVFVSSTSERRSDGRNAREVDPAAWHVVTERHLGRGKPPEALEAPGDEAVEPRVNRIALPSPVVEMTRRRPGATAVCQAPSAHVRLRAGPALRLRPASIRQIVACDCRGLGGQVALSPADQRARLANKLSRLTPSRAVQSVIVSGTDALVRHAAYRVLTAAAQPGVPMRASQPGCPWRPGSTSRHPAAAALA